MGLIGRLHSNHIFDRRARILSDHLITIIPEDAYVLDVGCGDGLLTSLIARKRPDLKLHGIDVLVRQNTHISVTEFDGKHFPFPDKTFDAVMFIDVLHHTLEPTLLLSEAKRIARRAIILKEHDCDGLFAEPTLRFMDWVGNARHGVALPYNYWSRSQWISTFAREHLTIEEWKDRLGLYPWPGSLAFDRKLHFIARLGSV